jgi:hypothetical protein
MFKRPLAGALDDRPIGERIAEGDAQFNHARTGIDSRKDDLTRGGEIGVAAGYVSDERWPFFEMKGHRNLVIGDL